MSNLVKTSLLLSATIFCNSSIAQTTYHQYIDPFIGSVGLGNVFVGPSNPFGMVKPGPDIGTHSNSGYDPDLNKALVGFSQIHVSGTGGGPKYGNISVMPYSGDFDSLKQHSLRTSERTKVGYYATELSKWGITAELATADRAAFHRYTFKDTKHNAIKIDGGFFLGEKSVPDSREAQQFVGSEVEVVSPTEVRGYSRIRGGWNNGSAYTVYYAAMFDQPCDNFSTFKGETLYPAQISQFDSAEKTGLVCEFSNHKSKTVNLKIGLSFISEAKAKQNLNSELPNWDFAQVVKNTQNKWEALISKIEVDKSTSREQKIMFYTGLYHTMLMPVDRSGENPLWTATPYYDDFYAIWDTFRSSSPLITLIAPKRQADIINAMLNIYQYDGYLPEGRSGNSNGRTQGGSNADVVIADAYVKKLSGVNYHQALKAMIKNATIAPGGNAEREGRGGLEDYNRLGYVSTDYVRAGNRTLEYAYNDFALATVAEGLERMGEYYRFSQQADNWQNLWRDIEHDGAQGFIMPKDAKGNWVDEVPCASTEGLNARIPYTPIAQDWPNCVCWWCGFFYEASSWEYSFYVPHDVAKLIEKSGGKQAFEQRLNTLFDKDYYNVGNEPSFLTSTLYHWLGKPYLSSDRIHQIIDKHYHSGRDGLPGNDDSGAMSSWLAFHMMGLYPNAGQPYYLLNTPYLKSSTLHVGNNKIFKIKADNLSDKNKYIVSATLNGKDFNKAWIEHEAIINGGELILKMGSKPSKWGSENLPPSKSIQH
ncbi:GH92 family glycosyl hydrolase [Paraglaciecola sp.]|uniref:GH92 family glycosyl hydrolase n=1 Tax=Paraglaciecola sp. TaxID=1920173 RepID=UPI00273E5A91|nr:GH92 family glycosyl hydrolase [Paraglaciecola sp.]MDP5030395.1 GH92 family glycosyl hydrolase [Paraglaciecola sp.]